MVRAWLSDLLYQLKVHLYSRTAEPFPILADEAYVTIPHTYIPVSTLHSYNSYITLGQEWDEKGTIYPPRRSWHRQPGPGELGWVYPYYEAMLGRVRQGKSVLENG